MSLTLRQVMGCVGLTLLASCAAIRADTGPIIEYTACSEPRLIAVVFSTFVTNTPDWEPGQKMPVSVEAATAAARKELERHLPDAKDLIFSRVNIIANATFPSKSYYLVFFHHQRNFYEDIMVPVNFSGVASRLLKPKTDEKEDSVKPTK